MDIQTENVRPGLWAAIDADTYDGADEQLNQVGMGTSEANAIRDLIAQLLEQYVIKYVFKRC